MSLIGYTEYYIGIIMPIYSSAVLLLIQLATFHKVFAIQGFVEPASSTGSFVIELGSDFFLNCTLRNATSGSQTAEDIVWYKGSKQLSQDTYSAIGDSVSQLALTSATFDNSTNYSCGFPEDYVHERLWIEVIVGTKPQPVKLECVIRNPNEYRCHWEEANDTNLRTEHHFQFRSQGGSWRDCPLCEENTCFVGIADNTGLQQHVRVSTTNALGDAIAEMTFDPHNDVVVNPPRDVDIFSPPLETSLTITWFYPDEWSSLFISLEYKLRYMKAGCQMTNLTCCCWKQIFTIGRTDSFEYKLQDLLPSTEYVVQLAARYGLNDKNWSEWTPVITAYTRVIAPSEIVGDLMVIREKDSSDDPIYKRDVLFTWTELQEENQHGPILGYKIKSFQKEGSEFIEELEWISTVTWYEVMGLHKYSPYQIQIAAYNSADVGPWTSIPIVDRTTAPNAPDWVTAVATTMTSINVSWGQPSQPNGIILNYIIQWRKSGADREMESYTTRDGSHRSFILGKLETYVLYEISVRGRTSQGAGEAAFVNGEVRTLAGVPDAAPSSLEVKPISNQPDSLALTWESLPIANINGDLQGYLIWYCQSESRCTGELLQHQNLSRPDLTSTTITGLESSTQYSVWLAAYTSVGLGPNSDHALGTTVKTASVVILPAILVPLAIVILIVIIISCVIRQVVNSQVIPEPKIVKDVEVVKMNGNNKPDKRMEQEIFDKLPDVKRTVSREDVLFIESANIEDFKRQSVKFSRSESNDSGLPPSPARSNFNFLRDRLNNEDDDSVFEESVKLQMTSPNSTSDPVGSYTRIGEFPCLKKPSAVTSTELNGNTSQEQLKLPSCKKISQSKSPVNVSHHTQMPSLEIIPQSLVPGKDSLCTRQQATQNRMGLPKEGANENQFSPTKGVSPYMSAMNSLHPRQPRTCREPSVGSSKCKKQPDLLCSPSTMSVPFQVLAMEAIKQNQQSRNSSDCQNIKMTNSPDPESPSAVSPYCKIQDLKALRITTRPLESASNSPPTHNLQATQPLPVSPISPYTKMSEINFMQPRHQSTQSKQTPETASESQTPNPLSPVSTNPVSPYIKVSEMDNLQPNHHQTSETKQLPPSSCATESLKLEPSSQTVSPYTQIPDIIGQQSDKQHTNEAKQNPPGATLTNPSHNLLSITPQPVSPYTKIPEKKMLETSQQQVSQQKQTKQLLPGDASNNPPLVQLQPVSPYILTPDKNTLQPDQQQTHQSKESQPNNPTLVSQQPVSPYSQMPETNTLQARQQQAKQSKQLPSPSATGGSPLIVPSVSPHSVSPYTQMPEINSLQPNQQQTTQSPQLSSEHVTLCASPLPVSPYTQRPQMKILQPSQQQTSQSQQLLTCATEILTSTDPAQALQTVSPYI